MKYLAAVRHLRCQPEPYESAGDTAEIQRWARRTLTGRLRTLPREPEMLGGQRGGDLRVGHIALSDVEAAQPPARPERQRPRPQRPQRP